MILQFILHRKIPECRICVACWPMYRTGARFVRVITEGRLLEWKQFMTKERQLDLGVLEADNLFLMRLAEGSPQRPWRKGREWHKIIAGEMEKKASP